MVQMNSTQGIFSGTVRRFSNAAERVAKRASSNVVDYKRVQQPDVCEKAGKGLIGPNEAKDRVIMLELKAHLWSGIRMLADGISNIAGKAGGTSGKKPRKADLKIIDEIAMQLPIEFLKKYGKSTKNTPTTKRFEPFGN